MTVFATHALESVGRLGERELIEKIRRWLGPSCPPAPRGIGDDCAIFEGRARAQVITVDPVVYGRHFDDAVPPRHVGAKLLKRNLSDLAAMGARPKVAVVSLLLDKRTRVAWLEAFYRGLARAAQTYGVTVVGGDVAEADGFSASLTLVGIPAGKRLLTRQGARRGDWIFVTGALGGSRQGHHYTFTPRLKEGAWLATRADVRSLMDLSDGLAKDLHALTPKNCRPIVRASDLPVSKAARAAALVSGYSPAVHALIDGEDYELLFTVDRRTALDVFRRAWKKCFPKTALTCLGYFGSKTERTEGAIAWESVQGYEHLR